MRITGEFWLCVRRDGSLPARSVFGVIAETASDPKEASLVVYGGEVDPSTQGHDGAGGFSSEVFRFTGQVGRSIVLRLSAMMLLWTCTVVHAKQIFRKLSIR